MKAVETVLHLRREVPRRMRHLVPAHVWALVAPYGLAPQPGETGGPNPGAPDATAAEVPARPPAAER